MKNIITFLLLTVATTFSVAQVVTTSPEFPTDASAVTLTFDASKGNAALHNFSGTIYAHTGVITSASTGLSDWKYVKTAWGTNSAEVTLTSIGNSKYTLEIGSSVRAYYGVPANEEIQQLAFVFRNSDGSKIARAEDGGDIYAQIYSETAVIITSPDAAHVYSIGETVQIKAAALFANQMTLKVNDVEITTVSASSIDYSFVADFAGENTITITATDGTTTKTETSTFFAHKATEIAALPAGLKQGANYIDDNTVTLVLYAPGKDFIFAKGSFGDWATSLDYQMKKTADGKYFWLTLEQLEKGKEYTYQYVIDGNIIVPDPYSDKYLDANNDQHISNTTYPDLIPFPTGKATEYVSVFQTAQPQYQWQVTDFQKP